MRDSLEHVSGVQLLGRRQLVLLDLIRGRIFAIFPDMSILTPTPKLTSQRAWLRWIEPESLVWLCGLAYLACLDPNGGSHYSICLFHALGISWCPGCGLGHSITLLFHGEIVRSFQTHPLGIVAVPVLAFRIITLELRRLNFVFRTRLYSRFPSSVTERTDHG